MKKMLILLTTLLCSPVWAQENTRLLNVPAYQWTTTHNVMTFSWPGRVNTSCNGSTSIHENVAMNGNISDSGNVFVSGDVSGTATTSSTCSTTYTPPTTQSIDIQKPVVFVIADSENSRMILTCTRNVLWSPVLRSESWDVLGSQ